MSFFNKEKEFFSGGFNNLKYRMYRPGAGGSLPGFILIIVIVFLILLPILAIIVAFNVALFIVKTIILIPFRILGLFIKPTKKKPTNSNDAGIAEYEIID